MNAHYIYIVGQMCFLCTFVNDPFSNRYIYIYTFAFLDIHCSRGRHGRCIHLYVMPEQYSTYKKRPSRQAPFCVRRLGTIGGKFRAPSVVAGKLIIKLLRSVVVFQARRLGVVFKHYSTFYRIQWIGEYKVWIPIRMHIYYSPTNCMIR